MKYWLTWCFAINSSSRMNEVVKISPSSSGFSRFEFTYCFQWTDSSITSIKFLAANSADPEPAWPSNTAYNYIDVVLFPHWDWYIIFFCHYWLPITNDQVLMGNQQIYAHLPFLISSLAFPMYLKKYIIDININTWIVHSIFWISWLSGTAYK